MAGIALTTLANAEAWIGVSPGNTATDAIIGRLINAATGTILAYLQRPNLLPRVYTETRDGTGSGRLMLRNWPVTQVSALSIDGTAVLPGTYGNGLSGTGGLAGYFFSAWDGQPPGKRTTLELGLGRLFCKFPQNVSVTYTAGYLVSNEAATVSAAATPANSVTALQIYGLWGSDFGVTYANGTALTAVTTAPAVGQYQLSTTPGVYVFNATDAGQTVLISYGFIPSTIEDACCQLVAERYTYRSRIGVRSKSFGGEESVSFNRSGLAPEIQQALMSYCGVAQL